MQCLHGLAEACFIPGIQVTHHLGKLSVCQGEACDLGRLCRLLTRQSPSEAKTQDQGQHAGRGHGEAVELKPLFPNMIGQAGKPADDKGDAP